MVPGKMASTLCLRALLAILLGVLPASVLAAAADADIQVRVSKDGPEITVDVDCPVKTSVAVAWEVLTDYDHMASFVSNLEESRVQSRAGPTLQVYQKGAAMRGPLKITFETVREVELVPHQEIRSRLIEGDLKASAFTTRIVDDGVLIHVINSGRYTPKIWVPPLIGPALIAAETRKQFSEIRAEILRRTALRASASVLPAPQP